MESIRTKHWAQYSKTISPYLLEVQLQHVRSYGSLLQNPAECYTYLAKSVTRVTLKNSLVPKIALAGRRKRPVEGLGLDYTVLHNIDGL